jgi:hypothetical protein
MISSAMVLEAKPLGRMVSNRGLRLLLSCPAISCEAMREASPTRTRIETSSATWRGSSERVAGEEGDCYYPLHYTLYLGEGKSGLLCRQSTHDTLGKPLQQETTFSPQ